eukprot:3975444-Amphidinium_carterae.1
MVTPFPEQFQSGLSTVRAEIITYYIQTSKKTVYPPELLAQGSATWAALWNLSTGASNSDSSD